MNFSNDQYGFTYGAAKVERLCSDERKGWVVLSIKTPKTSGHGIETYVTKTGKIRITQANGSWTPPV